MARLSGSSCIVPTESRKCATNIINSLSDKQSEKLDITSETKEGAIKAIAEIVQRHAGAEENIDVRTHILDSTEEFISYLEKEALVNEVLSDEMEDAQERYETALSITKKLKENNQTLGERLGSIDTSNMTDEEIESIRLMFSGLPDVLTTYERFTPDTSKESGFKTIAISYIVKEPIESGEKSLQEKAVDSIKNIRGIDKKFKKNVLDAEGKDTGKRIYSYNGKEIEVTPVTTDTHGFNPDQKYPVVASPIGTCVDTVGRDFFDKTSMLWDDNGELNTGELQEYIDRELGGIFTIQGLKNLIEDFSKLKNQIKELWGEDVIFDADTLNLFGKTKDDEGNDMWLMGKPDLLVIDKRGTVHVIDFKSFKMMDSKGYQNSFQNDPYGRGEDYGKQVSRYIKMLEAYGLTVDNNPYVIQIDTWYDSSDTAIPVVLDAKKEAVEFKGSVYTLKKEKGQSKWDTPTIGITRINPETKEEEFITLGKYAEEQENPTREDVWNAEKTILYIEPRLHLNYELNENEGTASFTDELAALRGKEDIPFDKYVSFEMQVAALTPEERANMVWFSGKPIQKRTAQGTVRYSEDDVASKPELIGTTEIQDVANYIMSTVSWAIDQIDKTGATFHIEEKKIGDRIYIKERTFGGKAFMHRGHEGLIKILENNPGGLNDFINLIYDIYLSQGYQENFPSEEQYKEGANEEGEYEEGNFYFENAADYKRQKKLNDKIAWLTDVGRDGYIHRKQVVAMGANKLMALEKTVKLDKNNNTSEVTTENKQLDIPSSTRDVQVDTGDDVSNISFAERYEEGLANLEAWMMGQRNYSPKASLAQEIRRMFEDIILLDKNGEEVLDPYGYGFAEHLDSTMAIQTILDLCKNCETIEEMKDTLHRASEVEGNLWIKQILHVINTKGNENLQKKFFRHFRKDAMTYSICQVKFDKKTGNRIVESRIINRKSAYETISQSLGADFVAGSVGSYWHPDFNTPLSVVSRDGDENGLTIAKGKTTVAQLILNDIGNDAPSGWYKELSQIWKSYNSQVGMSKEDYIIAELQKPRPNKNNLSVIDGITNILHGIGIMVPKEVVLAACTANISKGYLKSDACRILSGVKQVIMQGFKAQIKKKGAIPNGLAGNSAFRFYVPLLEKLSTHVQEHVEASVYQDGKTYYSYTNPSRLGHIIRNLKDSLNTDDGSSDSKFAQYMHDQFGRYEGWYKSVDGSEWMVDWLEQLSDTNSEANRALDHRVELAYIGNQYRDLGALGFQLSILHNYFGTRDDNDNWRWFALPTMSNKPTNEFIRMKKYADHEEIVDRVLMKTFQQELNRIADVLYHYTHYTTGTDQIDLIDPTKPKGKQDKLKKAGWSKEDIQGLKDRIDSHTITREDLVALNKITSGAKFHFLWYMNNEIEQNEDLGNRLAKKINDLLTPADQKEEESLDEDSTTLSTVRETIVNNMNTIVENELKEMQKIGLFEEEKRKDGSTVLKYQEEFKMDKDHNYLGTDRATMEEALTDFIWQDIAANINIIQITGGDLAYYGNAINYQKRIAQIHSPGLHLMHDEQYDDGYLRSVHISDSKAVSEVIDNAIVVLEETKKSLPAEYREGFEKMANIIISGLEEIDVTDGQSFSCPSSIRKKLALQGEWEDDMEEAWNKVRNGDFNINNLGVFLQSAIKPFVTSDMAKYSGSPTMTLRRTPLQDKNSEYLILLAEAISTGAGKKSKMKAIYDFMEATHKDGDGRHGIDTVHFASVGKVGLTGVIDINEFDNTYNGSEDNYSEALTEFLMKHVRRFDSTGESLQDEEVYNAENKLASTLDDNDQTALKWAELRYNSQYVDTIPVEDYIIQQEVPAHLLQLNGQLYGSQIRILGISDISEKDANGNPIEFDVKGQKMSAEELVKEYKELHAQNINESFNALMEEMGFDKLLEIDSETHEVISIEPLEETTIEQRNIIFTKLETLLQAELAKDAKYGFDARRACKLKRDSDGNVIDFTVPLMDPIQSNRIQMLLNSIIKKRINKQKITGGPVVQTTAYDNNLNIRFKDKNGNILMSFTDWKEKFFKKQWKAQENDKPLPGDEQLAKLFRETYLEPNQAGIAYFECYMPIPNIALERLLTNEDGSMMSFEEAKKKLPKDVWDAMTEVIGYRIPTEDKYSMLPLKIIGFVPKAAGQVIMMPKEITYLTGSDFDIDKMYIMKKAFAINFAEENQYGVTSTAVKNIISAYPKHSQIKPKLTGKIERIIINGNKILDERNEEKVSLADNLTPQEREELADFIEWYREQLLKNSFTEYTDMNSASRRKAKGARDNRILDLQWAVLTNEDTASKMLNPGNFIPQKKTGRLIKVLKSNAKKNDDTLWTWQELNAEYEKILKTKGASAALGFLDGLLEKASLHNTTLPSSKIYFQRQNMQGSQMVGIFANNNVSHAFCSFQKIGIDLYDGKHDNSFMFDGVHIGDHYEPTVVDPQRGFDGQLISKTIASFLAASVDTAKDPTLSDMNINTFTGGVAMTLARLGFDTESIGLFLSQPIIMDLSDLFFKKKTDGYYSGDKAIKEMMSIMEMKETELLDKSAIRDESLSKEEFLKHLTDTDYKENAEAKDYQLRILRGFHSLFQIARNMQDLTFCTKFNSVNNAVGPTIADTIEDKERVEKFIRDNKEGTRNTVFYIPEANDNRGYTSAAEVIERDPILKAFYEKTTGPKGASEIIFKSFFPHYFPGFQNVLAHFLDEYTKSEKINSKLYNQLLNEYLYFLLTYDGQETTLDGVTTKEYKPVIPYDNADMNSKNKKYLIETLIDRYREVQSIPLFDPKTGKGRRKNALLDEDLGANCLRIRRRDEYIATDLLVFNGSLLNAEAQEKVKTAWSELITMSDPNLSEKENTAIKRFGVDLFFYTLMRNGFGFSPKTLMHLASTIVRQNATFDRGYENYLTGLSNLKSLDTFLMGREIDSTEMIDRFLNQFIRNHTNNKQLVPNIKGTDEHILYGSDGSVSFVVDKNKAHELKALINETTPYKFVSVTTKDMHNKLTTTLYTIEDLSNPIKEEDGQIVVKYVKANILGFVNNFIEYNANEDIENSFFDPIRGESADSFEEEQQPTGSTGRAEQQEGDGVFGNEESNYWDAIRIIIRNLEGPQKGKSKDAKDYRNKLKKVFNKVMKEQSQLAEDFLSLIDKKKSATEKQSIMDKINEQNPCK